MSATIKVRVVSKAKNEYLARIVDECGSVVAAAKAIGVCYTVFSSWLNFRSQPTWGRGRRKGALSNKQVASIVLKLEQLSGVSIEKIFPGLSKAEMNLLRPPRHAVHEVPLQRLTSAVATKYLTYDPQGADGQLEPLDQQELRRRLAHAIGTLTYREREIIKLRFGLGDGYSHTLEEVSHIFRVNRERIRQIEAKALRKLKDMGQESGLADFAAAETMFMEAFRKHRQ